MHARVQNVTDGAGGRDVAAVRAASERGAAADVARSVVTAAAAPLPLLVRLLAPTTSSLRHLLLTPPGDPSPPSSRALSSQLLGGCHTPSERR